MSNRKVPNVNMLIKKSVHHYIKPEHIVILLFLVSMVSISVPYGFPLSGPLTLLFTLIFILFSRGMTLTITRVIIYYFFCSLIYLLSTLLSDVSQLAVVFTDIINILESVALYYLISQIKMTNYDKFLSNMFKATFFMACVIALLSIYKYSNLLNGIKLPRIDVYDRYPVGSSLVRDYNSFALVLNVGLISSLNILKNKLHPIYRMLVCVGIALITLSIIFSYSRRGWVILLGFHIVLFIKLFRFLSTRTKMTPHKLLLVILSLLLVIAILASVFINLPETINLEYLSNRISTLSIGNILDSLVPRTERIEFGLNLFRERSVVHKIIGGGFSYVYDFGRYSFSPNKMDYPHNPFVSSLLYSGLLGLIIFIIFVILLIWWVLKYWKIINTELIMVFIASSLVTSMSSNSMFSNMLHIFIMLLIMSFPIKSADRKIVDIKYRKRNG